MRMFLRHIGRLAIGLALLATLGFAAVARAETEAQPAAQLDFHDAPYVYIALGSPNDEHGIRLVEGQPDGLTEAAETGGRKALVNSVGPVRYIYFDVHDSYIRGGLNQVIMTITYDDVGLMPIDLEYDAYDVVNPANKADGWVKKRISVAARTNSGAVKTARVALDDARFDGNQPGGADFRLVSTDDLVIRNISLMRSFGPSNLPIRVLVNGQEVLFPEVAPFIHPESGSALVPMRRLFNALGIPDEKIKWDGVARTVTAQKGETTIILTIDSHVAQVITPTGTRRIELKQPAIIQENRTLIPLRFVAESLGMEVDWDPTTHLITIATKSPQP